MWVCVCVCDARVAMATVAAIAAVRLALFVFNLAIRKNRLGNQINDNGYVFRTEQ